MERKTLLTLSQLNDIVKGRTPAPDCNNCPGKHPGCIAGSVSTGCAAQEIGIIFLGENNKDAEKILVEMMSIDLFMESVGYAYLSQKRDGLPSEIEELVKAYEEKVPDTELLQDIVNLFVGSKGC